MFLFVLCLVFAARKEPINFGNEYGNCGACTYTRACQDKTKCKGPKWCHNWEAAQRAGFLCNGFPHYIGGYPLANLHWDNEMEQYSCLTDGSRRLWQKPLYNISDSALLEYFDGTKQFGEMPELNKLSKPSEEFQAKLQKMRRRAGFHERRRTDQLYCDHWETYEYSYSEQEFGECTCDQEDPSGNFCAVWSCEQEEIARCEAKNCQTIDRYQCRCNCDDDDACRTYIWFPLVEYEYSNCHCTLKSENGTYCDAWYCEEYDDDGFYNIEYEWYNCTEDNGRYCTKWFGDIDGAEEFEKAECKCRASGDNFCLDWTCSEKGLHYVYPNYAWPLLPFFLSMPCLMFAVGTESELFCIPCVCLIFCLGILLVAYLSGVWGIIILLLLWLCPLCCFCIFACMDDHRRGWTGRFNL